VKGTIRFGTDGWRGVIAEEFTFDNLHRVAHAAADYFKTTPGAKQPVLIGYDRRFFSPEFARETARVFLEKGLQVRLCTRPVTTPSVSVALAHHGYGWGIMITASHNPAEYNGFKIKEGSGRSAPPEVTSAIEQRILSDVSAPTFGGTIPIEDWLPLYEQRLKQSFHRNVLRTLRGSVVFDHLHGSSSGIPQRILKGLTLRVIGLHAEHDPLFGGLHPEPIEENLAALKSSVRKNRALLGIALDGDADRVGIVDNKGMYLSPHQVFPLLTLYGIEKKGWKGKIVQSVSLGALGPRIAEEFGLPFEEVPVGFKHVAERMLTETVAACGEESGGYAFQGGLPERDGILCGLLLLEMLAKTKKPLSQLVKDMERRFGPSRFHRIDIRVARPIWDKAIFVNSISGRLPTRLLNVPIREVRTMDGVKIIRQDGSWLLLRPSGTEPLIRTYAETSSFSETHKLLSWAQDFMRS